MALIIYKLNGETGSVQVPEHAIIGESKRLTRCGATVGSIVLRDYDCDEVDTAIMAGLARDWAQREHEEFDARLADRFE